MTDHQTGADRTPSGSGLPGTLASRQVAWEPVAMFVAALLSQANETPPIAGTPAWCALADTDPLKLLSVAVAGVAPVIDWHDRQEAEAEASKAIAAAADWPAVAREIHQRDAARRAGVRIERSVA